MAVIDTNTDAAIAAAHERLEEAIAVLGGIEVFDEETDGTVIQTILRIARVGVQKIMEAQQTLEKATA